MLALKKFNFANVRLYVALLVRRILIENGDLVVRILHLRVKVVNSARICLNLGL